MQMYFLYVSKKINLRKRDYSWGAVFLVDYSVCCWEQSCSRECSDVHSLSRWCLISRNFGASSERRRKLCRIDVYEDCQLDSVEWNGVCCSAQKKKREGQEHTDNANKNKGMRLPYIRKIIGSDRELVKYWSWGMITEEEHALNSSSR